MGTVHIQGALHFKSPKKLRDALTAFEARSYDEFVSPGDWTREKKTLQIDLETDCPADCVEGFPEAFRDAAALAWRGRVDFAWGWPDQPAERVYAGGRRVLPRPAGGPLMEIEAAPLFPTPRGSARLVARAWSSAPDGSLLALAANSASGVYVSRSDRKFMSRFFPPEMRDVVLLDAATGAEVTRLSGQRWWVVGLAFSPDGATLAGAGADGALYLWDVATGALVTRRANAHRGGAGGVGWSPDGIYVLSVGRDETLRRWGAPGLSPDGERDCEITRARIRVHEGGKAASLYPLGVQSPRACAVAGRVARGALRPLEEPWRLEGDRLVR